MKKGIISFMLIICLFLISCEIVDDTPSSEPMKYEIKKGAVVIIPDDLPLEYGRQRVAYECTGESITIDSFGEPIDLTFDQSFRWPFRRDVNLQYHNDIFSSVEIDPRTGRINRYLLNLPGTDPEQYPHKLAINTETLDSEQLKSITQDILTDCMGYDDIDLNEFEINYYTLTSALFEKKVNGVIVQNVYVMPLESGFIWYLAVRNFPGADEYVPIPDWDDDTYIFGAKERLLEKHKNDGNLIEFEAKVSDKKLAYVDAFNSYAVKYTLFYVMEFENGTTDTKEIECFYLFSF